MGRRGSFAGQLHFQESRTQVGEETSVRAWVWTDSSKRYKIKKWSKREKSFPAPPQFSLVTGNGELRIYKPLRREGLFGSTTLGNKACLA